jgi:ABC-type phosphate transport system substrate-binding protein
LTKGNIQICIILTILLGIFAAFSFSVNSQESKVRVIAHPSVLIDELSTSQIRRIFSMRQSVWPNQQAVVVFVLNEQNISHQIFSKKVLAMFPYQLERIWNKLVFSGLGERPIEVKDEQEMLAKIKNQPGAIGYVVFSPVDNGVKSIEIKKE